MWREAAILLAIAVACTVIGAAASLTLNSQSLAAARLAVPRCTAAGISVLQNLSGTNVASVTISGLPAGCGNAAAQATVNNLTTNGSGSATVPGAGGSVTVTLGVAPAASTTHETDILLTGP
jgi:hypothetical protein